MITDEHRRQVLSAVADLQTVSTAPSTQQLMDWVAGKVALQRRMTPFHGPAPWHGLQDVLAQLQADGLVEMAAAAGSAGLNSPPVAVSDRAVAAIQHPTGRCRVGAHDRPRSAAPALKL